MQKRRCRWMLRPSSPTSGRLSARACFLPILCNSMPPVRHRHVFGMPCPRMAALRSIRPPSSPTCSPRLMRARSAPLPQSCATVT
eukprot:8868832-Pyramimonas_sp.AAC.1